MKRKIIFECGETTCAVEPEKFCRFVGATCFGTHFICSLFHNIELRKKDGWLQRHSLCLNETKPEQTTTANPNQDD